MAFPIKKTFGAGFPLSPLCQKFRKGVGGQRGWREETLQRPEIQPSFLYPFSYAPLGEGGHISGEPSGPLLGVCLSPTPSANPFSKLLTMPPPSKIWPGPSAESCRGFCCINFGGFCRGFSWRIFLGTFSHKNEKTSGDKIREKIRRPKNKNSRKILRKILVSVKFVSAILGPEMAAPILWTPGKMRSFCRKNPCP